MKKNTFGNKQCFTALLCLFCFLGTLPAMACTSMIASGRVTKSGRPILWKHRDTGTEHNFIEKTAPCNGNFGHIALYNGGDSLLTEAWMGMNDAGFAIMNTASYNLQPDTAKLQDREGAVMKRALEVCRTVDDFRMLLDTLPKPLGVQANFGVLDITGEGAYFETSDHNYTVFYLSDATDGYMVRTNFSVTGNDSTGMGYIRYDNAMELLKPLVDGALLQPSDLTQGLSRSFYHSKLNRDPMREGSHWAVDQDFIPRRSSSASIAIEIGPTPSEYVMWTILGYPPCGDCKRVTFECVPDELRPLEPGFRAKECNRVLEMKRKAFPIKRGSGRHYVDLDYLRRLW